MFKKLLIHTRRSIKLIILISLAVLLILACIASFYKISYSVTINGEMVGYTDNKSKLQTEINDYIENGESENTAFVQVESLPEYKVCLLKRDVQASDEDIFNTIKSAGTTYYRYYSINENDEEKLYVANFTEAEDIINQLKEKNSKNMDNITISEKYETQMQDFTTVENAVSSLYVQKPQVTVAKNKTTSVGSVNTATTIAGGKVSLGISLARPVSGIISSRFGARSSIRSSAHTGLDIATSTGTPVLAAASGTVTFSGRKGSYGNLLVITHSNGVQTYYGHCSKLYVSAGTTVTQGQTVAAVGSTGNSTGPHLHFEIRVNGVAYNPQNYLY
ncbi:MAG: peptidoglycan DD-metalloendopeptidase family protein [Clostridia bacterium]